MREYGSNINLPSLDNLFSSEQERQDAKLEKIQILPLTELHPFRNHPFQVRDDDEMDKMVECQGIRCHDPGHCPPPERWWV